MTGSDIGKARRSFSHGQDGKPESPEGKADRYRSGLAGWEGVSLGLVWSL